MPHPRAALIGFYAFVWLLRVFSQSPLRGQDGAPTTTQDVGNAHGKQRTRDRTHNVHLEVGKVP